MKSRNRILAVAIAVPLVAAAFHVVSQTTTLGGNLVVIGVDAAGNEQTRSDGSYITFDYANGIERQIVVTQLADKLFANGFDDSTAREEETSP